MISNSPAPTLSIIIPIYREANTIVAFLESLRRQLISFGDDYEVIVVVDGDEDHSSLTLSKIDWRQLNVLINKTNYGKGFSIRRGADLARATNFLCFIDGDNDINPEGVIEAINVISGKDNIDFVYGSKLHSDSIVFSPVHRKSKSWLFAKIVSTLFDLKTLDTQTGLKLGRSRAMKKMIAQTKLSGFAFDVELFCIAESMGYSYVPIPIQLNLASQSSVNLRQSLTAVIDLLRIRHQLKDRYDL